MLQTSKNEAMPCMTIAIPLQCAATANHRSRRSEGRILLLQPTQTWPAREGKRKLRTNQKTPKLPDMERAAQKRNSYEKQKKRSALQSAFCTESRPVGLGEVRTRPYRPREQRRKRTFGSVKETKFQQNACKSEQGAVTGSQKALREKN